MATYKVVDVDSLELKLKTVADSIRAKGGTNAKLSFPDGMATAVSAITTGSSGSVDLSGVTATASDVLSTKMFLPKTGTITKGTMPENGAVAAVIGENFDEAPYTIPAGYHNGSGTVQLDPSIKTALGYMLGESLSTLPYIAYELNNRIVENEQLINQISDVLATKGAVHSNRCFIRNTEPTSDVGEDGDIYIVTEV